MDIGGSASRLARLRILVGLTLVIGLSGLQAGCDGTHPAPPAGVQPTAAEVQALADLKLFASRVHEWTLVAKRPQGESLMTLQTVRAATSIRDPACETYLLQIARECCGQYQEFAKEAAAQLVERGAARAELLGLVSEWRTDWLRAQAASWALARDATPEEIALFDSIEYAGSNGLDPGRIGTFDMSMGRAVAGWVGSLESMNPSARFHAILEQAAPLSVRLNAEVSPEYFWNPCFRRALAELRHLYERDRVGTLRMLLATTDFPEMNPGGPSPSSGPEPAALERDRAGWRERLVALLPAPAADDWRSMSTR